MTTPQNSAMQNPRTTALIVVDLQVGTTSSPLAHPAADVVANAARLADAFRAAALPVVLASVDGTPPGETAYGAGARAFPAEWAALVPEIGGHDGDHLVVRRTWSAFAGTDLADHLRAVGATRVVLAGLATSFGVESTARQAYDLGLDVVLVADAMSDRSLDAHEASVTRVFPALGVVTTTDALLAHLV